MRSAPGWLSPLLGARVQGVSGRDDGPAYEARRIRVQVYEAALKSEREDIGAMQGNLLRQIDVIALVGRQHADR